MIAARGPRAPTAPSQPDASRWRLACALAACLAVAACGRLGFDGAVAPADASPDAALRRLESLLVQPFGGQVTSATTLQAGVTYQLRVVGTFLIQPSADAEYMFNEPAQDDPDDLCDDGFTDMGLSIDDPAVDGEKSPKWGPYRPDHIYQIDFIGKGQPIIAKIHDTFYANNAGSLTLEIFGP